MSRWNVAFLLSAIVLVQCQYYHVEKPKHIVTHIGENYSGESGENFENGEVEVEHGNSQFMSRSGQPSSSSSQEDSAESVEEAIQRTKGRPRPIRLPPNFDELLKRKLSLREQQQKQGNRRRLQGDPSPIHVDDEDEGRRPESRLLWPFSIEISKGGGPSHHGSYTSWAESGGIGGGHEGGHGGSETHGWGSYTHPYSGWGEEEKGPTDEEILKSKQYKKYQKKKKKIMKKLKKKLKFKRLIQKILQKHITFWDETAPY